MCLVNCPLNWIQSTKHNTQITIWHRDFYDHIIRNEMELNNVRQYIIDNPRKWKLDKNYSIK